MVINIDDEEYASAYDLAIISIDHSCQTIDTISPLVVTDTSGHFIIDQSCLPFGYIVPVIDQFGVEVDSFPIEREIRVCAYSNNGYNCSEPFYVDPNIEVWIPAITIYE